MKNILWLWILEPSLRLFVTSLDLSKKKLNFVNQQLTSLGNVAGPSHFGGPGYASWNGSG